MLENDKNFNIPIHDPKHSSLSDCNFDSLSKEQVIDKYETVLTSREKQIQDLSELIGSYSDKLASAFERIKSLEEETESLKEKLVKKDQLIHFDQQNKEIMFLKLKDLEKELESYHQSVEKDRKSPIDSFINFFSRARSKSDANDNNIEKHSFDKFNMTHNSLNIEALSTVNNRTNEEEGKENKEETENIITKQDKVIEEEVLDKEKAVQENMDVLEKLRRLKERKSKSGVIKEGKNISLEL